MGIPADAHGFFSVRHRAQPLVLCASCGSRFDSGGATTGDRVRCPMCREVIELAQMIAEKRRYRHHTPPPSGQPRRLRHRDTAGVVLLIVGMAALAVLWQYREAIWTFVFETGRAALKENAPPK